MCQEKPIKNLKKTLTRQTILDTVTVLRKAFNFACDEYNLQLRDPFRDLSDFLPPAPPKRLPKGIKPKNIPVLRFDDAMKIIDNINVRYANVTRLMLLTGLSASEIAGIRKQDVTDDSLMIVNFVTRKKGASDRGKTPYRMRVIPLTEAIRACLEEAVQNAEDEYLFRTATGKHFGSKVYLENWASALKRSGIDYVRPYSTRHTFAAWALAIGVIPDLVVDLMGHGSKEMIYEVYGRWQKDLQKDVEKIRQFMGEDFGK